MEHHERISINDPPHSGVIFVWARNEVKRLQWGPAVLLIPTQFLMAASQALGH